MSGATRQACRTTPQFMHAYTMKRRQRNAAVSKQVNSANPAPPELPSLKTPLKDDAFLKPSKYIRPPEFVAVPLTKLAFASCIASCRCECL